MHVIRRLPMPLRCIKFAGLKLGQFAARCVAPDGDRTGCSRQVNALARSTACMAAPPITLYQINFSANWISRASVLVLVSTPTELFSVPVESTTHASPFAVCGG